MAKLAVSLLLLSLVPLCLCQPNCDELNVDYSGDAFSGKVVGNEKCVASIVVSMVLVT